MRELGGGRAVAERPGVGVTIGVRARQASEPRSGHCGSEREPTPLNRREERQYRSLGQRGTMVGHRIVDVARGKIYP